MVRRLILAAAVLASAGCAGDKMFRSDSQLAPKSTAAPTVSVPGTLARNAEIRSGPSESAPVLHKVEKGTQVTASEQTYRGFRRVKAADGRSGYVEEGAIVLTAGTVAPTSPQPSSVAPFGERPPGSAGPAGEQPSASAQPSSAAPAPAVALPPKEQTPASPDSPTAPLSPPTVAEPPPAKP
jgi:hypothetical protein